MVKFNMMILLRYFTIVREVKYSKVCRWVIGKIPMNKTPTLEGTVSLPPGIKPSKYLDKCCTGSRIDSNPVLQAEWKVDGYAASGLKVDSLALHNEKYKPFKGVKPVTKSGKFFIRS